MLLCRCTVIIIVVAELRAFMSSEDASLGFNLKLHCCEVSPELENLSSPTGWSIEMQSLEFL